MIKSIKFYFIEYNNSFSIYIDIYIYLYLVNKNEMKNKQIA